MFCKLEKLSDDEAFIVYRGKYCFVVLNAFPYNSGHIMIIPYRHIGSIEEMSRGEEEEAWSLVKTAVAVLKRKLRADGVNIGINIGRAAGAGVEGHIHIHVVPRWIGDSNFLPVIDRAKSLPVSLRETYMILKEGFAEIMVGDEAALDH